jgi:hypothetical protein
MSNKKETKPARGKVIPISNQALSPSGFHPWEDPDCSGCQIAKSFRKRGAETGSQAQSGAGCADHERPQTP